MSITKYQILVTVAECGSFTKAAELLGFTQSGISHAVTALESELGLKLLSRSRGGATLTADGRTLLPRFREMCELQRRMEVQSRELRGLDIGLVRIAAFASISLQWLPYILSSFRALYPGIEFELLQSEDNTQTEQWLLQGRVDCGFMSMAAASEVDTWLLHRDEWKVLTATDHPFAWIAAFPLGALQEEPFIQLNEGKDFEIEAVFEAQGISPNTQFTVAQDQTIMAMVEQGLGISIMPDLMLERSPYRIAAAHLPTPLFRDLRIAVKDQAACSRSTLRFVEHCQEWVAQHYGQGYPCLR